MKRAMLNVLPLIIFLIVQDFVRATAQFRLTNTAAELGSTVTLMCYHPQSTLCWEYQKAIAGFPTVISSNSQKYNIAVYDNTSVLTVNYVQLDEAGFYTCRACRTKMRTLAELVVFHSRCRLATSTENNELEVVCDVKYSTVEPPSLRCVIATQLNITDERLLVIGSRDVSLRLIVAATLDIQGTVFNCYALFNVTGKNIPDMATNDPEEIHIWTSPAIDLKSSDPNNSQHLMLYTLSAVLGCAVVVIIVLSVCRIRVPSKTEPIISATQTTDDLLLSPDHPPCNIRHTTVFGLLYAKITPRTERGVGHINQTTAVQQDAYSQPKSSAPSQCPLLMNSRSTYADIDEFMETTSSPCLVEVTNSQPNGGEPQSAFTTTVTLLNSRSTYADIDEFQQVPESTHCSPEPLPLLNSRSTYADIDDFGNNNIDTDSNKPLFECECTTDSKPADIDGTEVQLETSTVVPETAARADFGYAAIPDLDTVRKAQLVADVSPTSTDPRCPDAADAIRRHL